MNSFFYFLSEWLGLYLYTIFPLLELALALKKSQELKQFQHQG
jgi:hypothetical protein